MEDMTRRRCGRLATSAGARAMLAAAITVVAVGVLVGCGGPTRSVKAYCHEFYYGEGAKVHDELTNSSGPAALFAVGSANQAYADLFEKLDREAPRDIEPDVHSVAVGLQKGTDNAPNNAGSALAGAFVIARPLTNVIQWTDAHCGPAPNNGVASDSSTASRDGQSGSPATSPSPPQGLELVLSAADGSQDVDLEAGPSTDVNGPPTPVGTRVYATCQTLGAPEEDTNSFTWLKVHDPGGRPISSEGSSELTVPVDGWVRLSEVTQPNSTPERSAGAIGRLPQCSDLLAPATIKPLSDPGVGITVSDNLRVRTQPHPQAPILAIVSAGTQLSTNCSEKDYNGTDWDRVTYNGNVGWISETSGAVRWDNGGPVPAGGISQGNPPSVTCTTSGDWF